MFLAEPPRTAYDLHFRILGFDVRVSPFFWLAAALLGWETMAMLDEAFSAKHIPAQVLEMTSEERAERLSHDSLIDLALIESNPGHGMLLLIWIAAVFLSILVHELGHSLMMKRYGIDSYIVLYHFGGLAIPESSSSFMGMQQRGDPYQQIYISAAGPAIQLALAAAVMLMVAVSGFEVPFQIPYLSEWLQLDRGQRIASMPMLALIVAILVPSIFWALLNLLPVYPLDGGQIARELFTLFGGRDGIRNSLMLSVFTGGAVAVYGVYSRQMMLAVMFAILAFSSFQILQAYSGRGGYGRW